jgi:tRNA(Arg) A34 adenosine deaminase TadA
MIPSSHPLDITLGLPTWAADLIHNLPSTFTSIEQQMELVLHFAEQNFSSKTGGPFAAGVFEETSGRLVAIGVNRVTVSNCSSAHAEIMALSLAQKRIGTYDLGGMKQPRHQLVVNWCPCSMCFGAVLWSGIRSLVIAGSGKELEDITGFDEGPLPLHWQDELERRDIKLQDNILHDQAIALFQRFSRSGEPVYNGRLGIDTL